MSALPSATAVGNHLWQSTLFIGVCWLTTLLLKRNRASVRYWIWLAASLKLLVPFSILVAIGTQVGVFTDIRVVPEKWPVATYVYLQQNAGERQLFQTELSVSSPTSTVETGPGQEILLAGWLLGAAIVALWVAVRWWRLGIRIGKARLLSEGREVEALRRVQSRYGWQKPVRLASAASSVEPGVRGVIRPVLLLPSGITDRLTEDQLETILAHELCHIRRRDNFAAALHVFVQTIFWFHPLVWWIGSRLVEERERSCDEDVVTMGSDPRIYASAILRVCEFYLTAPAALVSRATGSNLSRRIEDIMKQRITVHMGAGRKIVLACATIAFVTTPVLFGMMIAPAPTQSAAVAVKPATPPAVPVPTPQVPPRQVAPVVTIPRAQNAAKATPPIPEESEYRIRPGDELDIMVWKQPELARRSLVRPDGKIGMPLLGDVAAARLTPMQLQSELRDKLLRYVSEPLVTVIVATPRKSFVTIQGAVARPGAYALEGRVTVMQLIAQAGGLAEFAKRDQVAVFREVEGEVRRYRFDYGAYVVGNNLEQNFVLKEDDIVIVP